MGRSHPDDPCTTPSVALQEFAGNPDVRTKMLPQRVCDKVKQDELLAKLKEITGYSTGGDTVKKISMFAIAATVGVLSMSTTAHAFNTKRCSACHSINKDKVGPAWKTVVEKYGDEATLAKDFEAGFTERRVANSVAKWKSKEGLMTSQFKHLIKGKEKEAAHALFETVKNGKFGNY